jgi:hypothetical protein
MPDLIAEELASLVAEVKKLCVQAPGAISDIQASIRLAMICQLAVKTLFPRHFHLPLPSGRTLLFLWLIAVGFPPPECRRNSENDSLPYGVYRLHRMRR